MSMKLENAKNLYLKGIRDGHPREAVTAYTGARYTQHSTGVGDGIEGFVAFFEDFIKRCPVRDIQVIRSIVDGQYVFCHVYQNINNGEAKWVTADLFDTDGNDKIIEHWDVIQAYEENTVSGHSMIDGPTTIEDLDKTEANKALVTQFCQDILIDRKADAMGQFISEQDFYQHSPFIADNLVGLKQHFQQLAEQGSGEIYHKIHRIIGQGNFVVAFSHVIKNGDDWCVFDLFRIKDGKIVEHWDIQEKILPKEQWGNSGKF
ncbi:nuclear transport factor 2 family protein [Vibrio alfacsensis]|uniref:nuclear transport factor 2 family protein n=1 Tax=Vibrio alfacsensis TaxID=1074311 RepID=UPI004068A5F5